MRRRLALTATLALAAAPATWSRAAPPTTGPLRVGADRALIESGLAPGLQRAFSADTGIAVKLVAGPATAVLEALKEGELDAAITNAPDVESGLDRQGLVHDRRLIAASDFVIVGPAPKGRGKAAPAGRSGAEVLARIREQAVAAPESVVFLSAGDGSGTHLAEQAMWRAAGIEPVPPWYVNLKGSTGLVGQVRARGAYALVERGAWAAAGAPLALLADGDPALAESVHAMRAFRAPHPAGKIFVAWIAGGRGRAVVSAHRGYRAPG